MRRTSNPAHPEGALLLHSTPAREMAAYDALPSAIRRVLREGPYNLSAEDALELVERLGEGSVLRYLQHVMQRPG